MKVGVWIPSVRRFASNENIRASILQAERLGYPTVVDMVTLQIPFPQNGIYTSTRLIRENPDLVHRYMRAYTEAIAIYKNNRDFAIKVTSKYTGIKDPGTHSSTVDFYAPKLARVPYPTLGGIRFVLDQIATRDPKAKNVAPESFMDLRFVKQLEESGFIKALYPKG